MATTGTGALGLTEEFAGAFEAARASGLPAIVELRLDPEAITPAQTLSGIRAAALKGRAEQR